MDIHKPKPVHGLREFAGEIGVIVCGVLIALAGEQVVEALHWHHKVHQAEEALRLELVEDNAPQAFIRMASARCHDQQLDGIKAAVEQGRDRKAIAALIAGYIPERYTWDSEAWRVALASDVGSHTSADRMILWSSPYRVIPVLADQARQEDDALGNLQLGDERSGPPTDEQRERLLRAVFDLRRLNQHIRSGARTFLRSLVDLDMEVPAEDQRKLFQSVRQQLGDCVLAPDYRGTHLYDYANSIHGQPAQAPAKN